MPQSKPKERPLIPRQRAAALFAEGLSRAEVARTLGVCRSTTSHWYRVWQQGGTEALVEPGPRGRKPKIETDALEEVQRLLTCSPRSCGFDLDTWSLAAIVAVIHRSTGVTYHPRHVTRVLRRLGWVLVPVGKTAHQSFRQQAYPDPDGNQFLLRQHWNGN
jgi:transposase